MQPGYQQPYQQPMYPQQPPNVPGKGMAIGSIVCGILSLVFGFMLSWLIVTPPIGLICGIVGLIMGVMGSKQMKMAGAPSGMATAGLVMSIIGLVFSAIFTLTCTICLGCFASEVTSWANGF